MLILIGRGLDLKEELEFKGKRSESEAERKDIAREFEVNFHCAVFKVWEKPKGEKPQPNRFPVTMA